MPPDTRIHLLNGYTAFLKLPEVSVSFQISLHYPALFNLFCIRVHIHDFKWVVGKSNQVLFNAKKFESMNHF